ncbi:MAG: hypothetical protein GQ570_03730 [Helicobacteraceae bacterium]|nr:hypothetical protein [Helicobacteraceae bacterium]
MPNDEWRTPSRYIESARKVLGKIDVDPASNDDAQNIVLAGTYYSKHGKVDCFTAPWTGRVWLNPPYSKELVGKFVSEACRQYSMGIVTEAVVLTNNTPDTKWFAGTLALTATAFCFVSPRIQFIPPAGTKRSSNSKGQVFSYLGKDPSKFIAEFKQYGMCVIPI